MKVVVLAALALALAAAAAAGASMSEHQDPHAILTEHSTYDASTAHTAVSGLDVLGYVTPWNGRGYDMAKTFAGKFKYIAPVWFSLKPSQKSARGDQRVREKLTRAPTASRREGFAFAIEGDHNVDAGWLREYARDLSPHLVRISRLALGSVRDAAASAGARPPLIVPRVNLELFGEAELNAIVRFSGRREQIVSLIVAKVKEHSFDGIVLEAGYAIKHFSDLVRLLGQRLHEMRKHLVVVVPPVRGTGSAFGGDDLLKMAPFVDHFSLMTYDYTTSGQEGPNAPIKWCAAAVEHLAGRDEHRQQVLMGLNFYGNDYVEGASEAATVLGHDIVARLSLHSNRQLHFEWAPVFAEHTLRYVDNSGARHAVVYPTRASIQARIDLARKLHVGIAIWEIGQGLDYFFELL